MRHNIVYIVDDDLAVRDSIAFFLKVAGYAPRQFADATAFLDAAAGLVHGCVLLDIRMPGIDGIAVLERLREAGNRLPVIVMTGHGDTATAVRAAELGARNYIEKPFEEDTLIKSLAQTFAVLDGARPRRDCRVLVRPDFPHLIMPAVDGVAEIGAPANTGSAAGITACGTLHSGTAQWRTPHARTVGG